MTVDWPEIFLYYRPEPGKPLQKKFTPEQILQPSFALCGRHCKLCDRTVEGDLDEHLRKHKAELRLFVKKRERQAQSKRNAGLRAARRKQREEDA